MNQANLVPIPRRMARQRQHRIRLWMSVCTAYCVLLVITYGTLNAMWGHGDQVIVNDVSKLTEEIAQTDKEMKAVAPRLNDSRLTLAASMAVGGQPDWSILLALLAQEMREHDDAAQSLRRALLDTDTITIGVPDAERIVLEVKSIEDDRQVVLSHCELKPVSEMIAAATALAGANGGALPGASPSITQPRYTLALTGMGKTQAAISQYVLRLENTGLFSRVTLIESRLAPFGSGEAVSFRIGCTLGEVTK